MSSLVFPSLSMKDHEAVTILHYPGTGMSANKANGGSSHVPAAGLITSSAASMAQPSKPPAFSLQTSPHLLASMQLQKLNSQYHGVTVSSHPGDSASLQAWSFGSQPLASGALSPTSTVHHGPGIIDSDPVDEEVLMSLVVELGLDRAMSSQNSGWGRMSLISPQIVLQTADLFPFKMGGKGDLHIGGTLDT